MSAVESEQGAVPATGTCFVIGPIGKRGTEIRKHSDLLLNLVIKEALSACGFVYQVKRGDEDPDPGMIGDRIILDLLNSDLVIADLSELNPNVFYELGIRHSIAKPVIHIAKSSTQLPFDTINQRTIFVDLLEWESIVEARRRLIDAVKAVREPGYIMSTPITQANASFRMRTSGDPLEVVLAQIQEKISRIETNSVTHSYTVPHEAKKENTGVVNNSFIFIDLSSVHGKGDGYRVVTYPYEGTVGRMLDWVFIQLHHVDSSIQPYTYKTRWIVESMSSEVIDSPRAKGISDERDLDEANIYPNNRIRVRILKVI